MRRLLSRVLKALRSILRALKRGAVYGAHWLDGFAQGLFGGSGEIEDFEETVVETAGQDVVEEPVARPVPEGTVAQRVKNAILALDAGRSVDAEFDLGKPEHVLARDWFKSLDESGLRALRHMPMPALGAHLNVRYSVRAAGLPRFPLVANANAPAVAGASDAMDFEAAVAVQPRP